MIRPIETSYRGYLFRSRLEARWAVFFDALGIQWEYEKEGFDLGNAGYYLPDFWLPEFRFWVEIKPTGIPISCEDWSKIAGLGVILLQGEPGNYSSDDYRDAESDCSELADLGRWGVCAICGRIRFGYRCAGEFSGTECDCAEWDNSFDTCGPRIAKAIETARSARFEHR